MSYFLGSKKSRSVNGEHQDSNEFNVCVENIISELNKYGKCNGSYDKKCEYIRNELDKLPRKPNGEIPTIPQHIRLGIYYIAFNELKKNKNFQQKKLINDLKLSKNVFQDWELYPLRDSIFYSTELFTPKVVRNGIKSGKLRRMIQFLLTSQNAEYFADVFGGTGAVTSSVSSYFKLSFLNELDDSLFNMLKCIKEHKEEMLNRCRQIIVEASNMNPNSDSYKSGLKNVEKFNLWEYNRNVTAPMMAKYEEAERYIKRKKSYNNLDINAAAYLYFIMSYRIQMNISKAGVSGLNMDSFYKFMRRLSCDYVYVHAEIYKKYYEHSLTGELHWEDLNISFKEDASDSEIYRWSESLKDVELIKEDYEAFYKYVSCKVDFKKIIWYFDPPYFMTDQYKNTFSDKQHVKLIETLKEISNNGGKWVFSCKDKKSNRTETKKISKHRKEEEKDAIIKKFEHYFAGFIKNISFIDEGKGEYILKRKGTTKNHDLYVYKLETEQHNEIVITNFDCPTSAFTMLNNVLTGKKHIPAFKKETFEEHFKDKIDKIRHDIKWK